MGTDTGVFPSKHFLFSKASSRHLEDVNNFSSSQTFSRRLQDVFAKYLPKTSSRRFGRPKKSYAEDIFNTSSPR